MVKLNMIYLPVFSGIKGQHVKINAMGGYIIIAVLFLILFIDTMQTLHEDDIIIRQKLKKVSKKRSRQEETQYSNMPSEDDESQRRMKPKPNQVRDIPENDEDEQTNVQDGRQILRRTRTQKGIKGILKDCNNGLVDFISDTFKNGVKLLPKLGQKDGEKYLKPLKDTATTNQRRDTRLFKVKDSFAAKYAEKYKEKYAAAAESFERESKRRKELHEENLRQARNDIQNYREQEEKLFSTLITLHEKNGSEKKESLFSTLKSVCQTNQQLPELNLAKAYMWYSAFFLAVNLKICSLAYSSLKNIDALMPGDYMIKRSCDLHFTFINFALRKFRPDIKNCVPDGDIGNELEKIDLDFIMNENEMKENNEYDYRNGLIMWNKIHSYSINERTRRTLFPNHYIVLGIGYFNEFVLYNMIYQKISEVINWEMYEKILQYFSKKMIGKPLSFDEIENFFNPLKVLSENFWRTWVNHDKMKLGNSVNDNIIKTIQLINVFRQINTKKTLDFLPIHFI